MPASAAMFGSGKDITMQNSLLRVLFIFALVIFSGCVSGKFSMWRHFHGDLPNQGFQDINSGFALSSSWASNPYKITSSSPVIGKDIHGREIVYIGTVDGMLVALRSEDGSEKWKRRLGSAGSESRIVSSASVSDKGNIYVISNRKVGNGRISSSLHKVDHFGYAKWSYTFPDNGFTTGSPKAATVQDDTLIFVYVSVEKSDTIQGELFVLRDDGYEVEMLDRKALSVCNFDLSDTTMNLDDFIEHTWDLVSGFPVGHDDADVLLPDYFVDPTVAVVTGREKPLIAIADNLCSLGVFEWDGVKLSVIWRQEHSFDKHSSLMISPGGLMVFGKRNGKVSAYDLDTGVKMWEHSVGQAVFATPAASHDRYIFVVAKDQIQVISALDGTLIHDDKVPRKLSLLGSTYSSPAVTANRVYLSTFEMLTLTYDLKTRGHDTNFHGNGLSSVVVGSDGSVYGVALDGMLHKYAGTGKASRTN